MSSANIQEFTDGNFEAAVIRSDKPTLVEFSALWCGPCRALTPVVHALAEQYQGAVKIGTIDVDDNPRIAAEYGVRSVPALLLFKGGKVVDQLVGAGPRTSYRLEEAFKKVL